MSGKFWREDEPVRRHMTRCGSVVCGYGNPLTAAVFGEQSAEEAVALMQREGWRIEEGQILCPGCAQEATPS